MVNLGNVDNTSDLLKPISKAEQDELDLKADLSGTTFTGTVSGITKAMVNLGNVDNTADVNKPVSTLQQAELDKKADLAGCTFTGPVSGITKAMVGLANVDNTTDLTKGMSNVASSALLTKINKSGGRFETDISLNGNLILSSSSSKIKYNATSANGQVLVNDATGLLTLGTYPTIVSNFSVITGTLLTTAVWTAPVVANTYKTCASIELLPGNYILYGRVGIIYSGSGSISPKYIRLVLNTLLNTDSGKLSNGEFDHYIRSPAVILSIANGQGHLLPSVVTNISASVTTTYYINIDLSYVQTSGIGNIFVTNSSYTGQSYLYALKVA